MLLRHIECSQIAPDLYCLILRVIARNACSEVCGPALSFISRFNSLSILKRYQKNQIWIGSAAFDSYSIIRCIFASKIFPLSLFLHFQHLYSCSLSNSNSDLLIETSLTNWYHPSHFVVCIDVNEYGANELKLTWTSR